jgi:hypothetical protein
MIIHATTAKLALHALAIAAHVQLFAVIRSAILQTEKPALRALAIAGRV